MEVQIRPITRTVLQIVLTIEPDFQWNKKIHGGAQHFWILVEDGKYVLPCVKLLLCLTVVSLLAQNENLYHSEYFTLRADKCLSRNPSDHVHTLTFTIPIFDPMPPQYFVRACSDAWLESEFLVPIVLRDLVLPSTYPPHTPLLDLQPLPKQALKNPLLEELYSFTHFNPIQTQIFHSLYHSDENVLVGAPTGSGKTVAAELAIFRLFREHPTQKAVYIAPLKVCCLFLRCALLFLLFLLFSLFPLFPLVVRLND